MDTSSSRVRMARSFASISQAELARRIGVQRSAVAQWERRGGTIPTVEHLARIASETGVYFEWIATGRGPRRPNDGELTSAALIADFAKDEYESQVLIYLRRLSLTKKKAVLEILEILSR
jgi:transcriptional regulator with XRE-family HTH domain